MSDYELKMDGLEKLLKTLKGRKASVRVGIIGSDALRQSKDGGPNNATIGAFHEFGTSKLPVRSFLRGPITDHLAKRLLEYGPIPKEVLAEVLKKKSFAPWLQIIGVIAEGIVAEAFGSNGFGKWPPWSSGYQNNTGQILVDTQQLRNSISSEVVEAS